MADQLQPPPTYAEVAIVDEKTGRTVFNPIWLNWFIELVQVLNAAGGSVLNHNLLFGLQGGTTNEYYHLTQAQHTAIGTLGSFGNNRVVYTDGSGALTTSSALGFDGTTLSAPGLSNSGNTVLGDAAADTITFNAAAWTYSNNWTATRTIPTSSGTQVAATENVSYTPSGGANTIIGHVRSVASAGTNLVTTMICSRIVGTHQSSSTMGTLTGLEIIARSLSPGGAVTTINAHNIDIRAAANVTTMNGSRVIAPTVSAGTVTTLNGHLVQNLGNASVTTAIGLKVDDFTASTNMRGLQSSLSSGSGKFNIYADGTADNALAGNVRIGSTTAPTVALDVTGSINVSVNLLVSGAATISSLTGGRMPLVSTAGLLADSATFTYVDAAIARNLAISGSGSIANSFSVTNTHASGVAQLSATAQGSGAANSLLISATGATYIGMATNGVNWSSGVDVSAANRFVISKSAVPGTADMLAISVLGSVITNASGAALGTTATDGFTYIPSCPGTPTGVPTAVTGTIPLVVDSTNNKLYFYSGGAWRDAGP